jgi:hypothetical protein
LPRTPEMRALFAITCDRCFRELSFGPRLPQRSLFGWTATIEAA